MHHFTKLLFTNAELNVAEDALNNIPQGGTLGILPALQYVETAVVSAKTGCNIGRGL